MSHITCLVTTFSTPMLHVTKTPKCRFDGSRAIALVVNLPSAERPGDPRYTDEENQEKR